MAASVSELSDDSSSEDEGNTANTVPPSNTTALNVTGTGAGSSTGKSAVSLEESAYVEDCHSAKESTKIKSVTSK